MASVDEWLAKVRAMTQTLELIKDDMLEVTATMESVRDAGFQNTQKEEIDVAYSDLINVHRQFCDVRAGGRRTKRRKTRRSRN